MCLLFCSCSHTHSEQEYAALQADRDICTNQLEKCRSDKIHVEATLAEARRNLEKASADITAAYSNKQDLLDKNIDCLEENRNLLKQISRLKALNQEKKEALTRLNKANDYLLDFLESERMNDQLYIVKNDESVKIIIPQKVLFPTSFSAWITPKGAATMKRIAKGLVDLKPLRIQIDGHTDSTPIPKQSLKTFPTQWDLSNARAVSVLVMLEGLGLKKGTFSIGSFGDTRPLAEITSEEGKLLNRRVELVITP